MKLSVAGRFYNTALTDIESAFRWRYKSLKPFSTREGSFEKN